MKLKNLIQRPLPLALLCVLIIASFSCNVQNRIARFATADLLNTSSLRNAHVGVSIYDPATAQYLYNYQGDKYFVPASNVKLFSLCAGMTYLGDSLPAARFVENDTSIVLFPTGDPTLLHPDFINQPVIEFLKKSAKSIYVNSDSWHEEALGAGWSWDDYNDDYMPERSSMPVYGNVIHWIEERQQNGQQEGFSPTPNIYSVPDIDWKVRFSTDTLTRKFIVRRNRDDNIFVISQGNEKLKAQDVPFVTNGNESAITLLKDTVSKKIFAAPVKMNGKYGKPGLIRSRPADSMYRPMMYRSDNFFAEQTLLMVSNERFGIMSDEKIIDTLLASDFAALPQKPSWVDGCGLSRFNLFSPQDLVWVLNSMKEKFGLDRMKRILPTGGAGTLGRYYKQDSNYIFAKTGSLSGVICLSGYLITEKNRLLIFSVLVNNHHSGAAAVRTSVAAFLDRIRKMQ